MNMFAETTMYSAAYFLYYEHHPNNKQEMKSDVKFEFFLANDNYLILAVSLYAK